MSTKASSAQVQVQVAAVSTSAHTNPSSTIDAVAILDTIDSFRLTLVNNNNGNGPSTGTSNGPSTGTSNGIASNGIASKAGNGNGNACEESSFDPVDFLNHHYQTEASLINALPSLQSSLNGRITKLDESISSTIQKQADLADLTLSDVSQAKTAIADLHTRILLVQTKARQSEATIQKITQEMKKLDYAKKHLSKTITALKRLHMLLHAITQLRYCVRKCSPPDYANASNLVDATYLLLSHFDNYMNSVPKMKMLKYDVEQMRMELKKGVLVRFRMVGFGTAKALEMQNNNNSNNNNSNNNDSNNNNRAENIQLADLTPQCLFHACHVLDALGQYHVQEFVHTFCKDHLEPYQQLFHPSNNATAAGSSTSNDNMDNHNSSSTGGNPTPSFKISTLDDSNDISSSANYNININNNPSSSNPNQASLDQMERRYAWYRRFIKNIDETFTNVFPKHWNMYYQITHSFLFRTHQHILLLFANEKGNHKHLRDRDCENVTVLLKALQKTMLFEKEMTAWLQREYKVEFLEDPNNNHNKSSSSQQQQQQSGHQIVDENGEPLEFDESGKAVSANSAEGIRIKYERQMKERKKKEAQKKSGTLLLEDEVEQKFRDSANNKNHEVKPVQPLIGVASTAVDKYMKPYISLEQHNMEDQLVQSALDKTVDTRGELPVFTSSTALFLYIKNSITRCTVLTSGRTLFLLFRAFQNTLRKYAKVLSGKFPTAAFGAAATIGGITIGVGGLTGGGSGSSGASNANTVYRIPPGEEMTVCYAIDTCEYCSDTVEALQDLIADKIEEKYKTKIDMSSEQEAFHDVTAKGILVLVSGLIQRTDQAFKSLSSINWSSLDVVGEESKYVRSMHDEIQPFVVTVKGLLPNSYFRSFCDQFATTFTNTFYIAITRCKRISESGTQQLLLDVYNLKTLLLRVPTLEAVSDHSNNASSASAATIAPAMYTKMVTKQFARIETLLKLIGTPSELLIDVFKVQWNSGSALDLQSIMNLKGMKRNEQAAMLEKFGVDPVTAYKGAAAGATSGSMTDNIQALQDRSSDVAAKVNSDLIQMKQKVEDFRKAFR